MMNDQKEYFELLEQTKESAFDYLEKLPEKSPFPPEAELTHLSVFREPLPESSCGAEDIIRLLAENGWHATTAQAGGRFFGFVVGGLLPVAHAASWLADTWNQNSGLYAMSPLVSELESVCERWLTELFGLPDGTAMGLATGSANALICALAAARNDLFRRQGYDLKKQGMRGAPAIRVVLSEQAHSTVKSALSILGFGEEELEYVSCDASGRMRLDALPALDAATLLLIQAGNVNGGSFDPIEELCDRARAAGAWTHIDGAFGLWAAASRKQSHLTRGMEKADSWSTDAHKTLNAGYDCGIVLCRHREALAEALQASGAYIPYSPDFRDNMLYTTEMSRRARVVPLWAVLKQLGREGIEELVDRLCENAEYFAERLRSIGLTVVNPVCFNQFLVRCSTPEKTQALLRAVQEDGVCWCGGSTWDQEPIIRISVCSHRTTRTDLDASARSFAAAWERLG